MHSLTHVDGSPIRHLIVAAVGALALLLGNGVVLAQDDDMPGPVEEQVSPSPDEQDEPDSYPENWPPTVRYWPKAAPENIVFQPV